MTRLQKLKNRLNLKVTLAGSAIIIATSFGSCQLTGNAEPESAEPIEEPAPVAPEEADVEEVADPA
jgi:hypothetical protein